MLNKLLLVFSIVLLTNGYAFADRSVLTGSDLVFDGAFKMPATANGHSTSGGVGLALRKVSGNVRIFSTAYDGSGAGGYSLYEVTVPELVNSSPWSWNTASIATSWGDVFPSQAQDSTAWINGLYWDETDQRLYYFTIPDYINDKTTAFTSDYTTGVLTVSDFNWGNGEAVVVTNTGGSLPSGLSSSAVYYIVEASSATAFKLSATPYGDPVTLSNNGTGTHSISVYPYSASLGFVSGFDGTPSFHGKWGYSARSLKMVNYGALAIPSDFATSVLGDSTKRLAAGFGGYQSSMSFGPVSMGPALTAFSPPSLGTEGSYIANTPLVGYGGGTAENWVSGEFPVHSRAWRYDDVFPVTLYNHADPDGSAYQGTPTYWSLSGDETLYWQGNSAATSSYSTSGINANLTAKNDPSSDGLGLSTTPNVTIGTKHWVPGRGFWNWDFIKQSGAWVQTSNKEGVLFIAKFSTGLTWYWDSSPISQGTNNRLVIYSKSDIQSVAEGAAEDSIQPSVYHFEFPDKVSAECADGLYNACGYDVVGMALDSQSDPQKLYVMVSQPDSAPPVVYVYHIDDSSVSTRAYSATSPATGYRANAPVIGLAQ